MAAAAIQLAEVYQRQGRARWAARRWFVLFVAITCGAAAVWFATGGEVVEATLLAMAALTNLAALAVAPMFWPEKVARSLEASRAVLGSDE